VPEDSLGRFVGILDEDEDLQLIYSELLQRTSLEEFEKIFRRYLLKFSTRLRMEAVSPEQIQAANICQTQSRNSAYTIRHRLQAELEAKAPVHASLPLIVPDHSANSRVAVENDQSDSEASDEEDFEPIDNMEETFDPFKDLREFVLSSNSLKSLKESLRLLVHPDPIKQTLSKIWPVTLSRATRHVISYEVEWEVPKFLRAYFSQDQQLGDILTLTGDAVNAQALSCRDYLSATWASTGPLLLKGLETVLAKIATTDTEGPNIVETSQQSTLPFGEPGKFHLRPDTNKP
jgi:hypothetical protein